MPNWVKTGLSTITLLCHFEEFQEFIWPESSQNTQVSVGTETECSTVFFLVLLGAALEAMK